MACKFACILNSVPCGGEGEGEGKGEGEGEGEGCRMRGTTRVNEMVKPVFVKFSRPSCRTEKVK